MLCASVALALSGVATSYAVSYRRIIARWWSAVRLRCPRPAHGGLALVDPVTSADALALLTCATRGRREDDTAALMNRLVHIFVAFPPRERHLRCMSLEQQRLSGTGGKDEFAVTTVYTVMMLAIIESSARRSESDMAMTMARVAHAPCHLSRSHSAGGSIDMPAWTRRTSLRLYSTEAPKARSSPDVRVV